MGNTYDLANAEHLVSFDRDCAIACNASLKQHSKLHSGEFSIARLFVSWSHDGCLWDSGYHVHLNQTARNTFKRYAIVDRKDLIDLETKKEFKAEDKVRLKQSWKMEAVPRMDLDF